MVVIEFVRRNFMLFFSLLLFIFIQYLYISVPPLYDGMWYYRALLVLIDDFNFRTLNLFDHISFLYSGILYVLYFIKINFIYLYHIFHLLLGIIGIISFYLFLKYVFGDKYKFEIGFIILIFSIHPLILSNSLNLSLDYIFLNLLLLFLYLFFTGKLKVAFIIGIFVLFVRELGVIFIFLFLILYQVFNYFNLLKGRNYKYPFKTISIIIFLYILLILFYKLIYLYYYHSGVWGLKANVEKKFYDDLFPVNFLDPYFIIRFVQVFVLNFSWVMGVILFYYIIKISFTKNRNENLNSSIKIDIIVFLSIVYLGILNLVLPLKGNIFSVVHTNTRYVMFLIPFFLFFFLFALISLIKIKKYRILLLFVIFILNFLSNFRSFDPISFLILGKNYFGIHKMYCMTSLKNIKGDKIYCGRDEMIYNLEYTYIYKLLKKAFENINFDEDYVVSTNLITYFGVQKDRRYEPHTYEVFLNSNLFSDFYGKEGFYLRKQDCKDCVKIRTIPECAYYTVEPNKNTLLNKIYFVYDEVCDNIFKNNLHKYLYYIRLPIIIGDLTKENEYLSKYYNKVYSKNVCIDGYCVILEKFILKN